MTDGVAKDWEAWLSVPSTEILVQPRGEVFWFLWIEEWVTTEYTKTTE